MEFSLNRCYLLSFEVPFCKNTSLNRRSKRWCFIVSIQNCTNNQLSDTIQAPSIMDTENMDTTNYHFKAMNDMWTRANANRKCETIEKENEFESKKLCFNHLQERRLFNLSKRCKRSLVMPFKRNLPLFSPRKLLSG